MNAIGLFPSTTRVDSAGSLWIGGCRVSDLADRFGTPLYIYDEDTLRARCREAREAMCTYPGLARVAYASKAFLCIGMAQIIAQEGLGLDVVSNGEMACARAAGTPRQRVHLHGNNKSREELVTALDWGIGTIVVDGWSELEMLGELTSGRTTPQRVWLRVAPSIDVHTHAHRKTGLLDSKFGFTLETGEASRALRQARGMPGIHVAGLHAHIGSQVFEPEPFAHAARLLVDLASAEGFVPEELSPGGGWGCATDPAEPEAPMGGFATAVSEAVTSACAVHGMPLPTLVVELGRGIAAPAGVAVYTVGRRKEIPGVRTFVAVDGGMGDNVRPALYQAGYTALSVERADAPAEESVTLAGRYCESGDVIARDVPLPRLRAGERIAVPRSGAYCLPLASNYNMTPRPAVLLVRDGVARLLQRRETVDDLLARDRMLE